MSNLERINPLRMVDDLRLSEFHELCLFLGGSDDSWTGVFLGLVGKSDPRHRAQLAVAFPLMVRAWEIWVSRPEVTVASLTRSLLLEGHR